MNMQSAADIAADYEVVPGPDLVELVRELAQAQTPVMLWGPPGIGKSHLAQQSAQALRFQDGEAQMPWRYVDIRALTMEPIDLRGMMFRDGAVTRYAPPSFLPPTDSTAAYLINFEELPSALPAMQAALYQLIQDRRVGDYELPPGASMIACGNRESDRGLVHKMLSPLASRFVHIDVGKPDAKMWRLWALPAGIRPEVFSFIRFRPEMLHRFDPKLYERSGERAFPCPRTWEMVSRVLERANLNSPNLKAAVRGLVGAQVEQEFTAFLRIYQGLPMPDDILLDPQRAPLFDKTEPAKQIAVCGAVAHIADKANMLQVVAYAKRMRPELAEYMVDCAVRRDAALRYGKAWIEWESWINRQ